MLSDVTSTTRVPEAGTGKCFAGFAAGIGCVYAKGENAELLLAVETQGRAFEV